MHRHSHAALRAQCVLACAILAVDVGGTSPPFVRADAAASAKSSIERMCEWMSRRMSWSAIVGGLGGGSWVRHGPGPRPDLPALRRGGDGVTGTPFPRINATGAIVDQRRVPRSGRTRPSLASSTKRYEPRLAAARGTKELPRTCCERAAL